LSLAPRSTRPGVLGRPPAAGGRCSRCRVRGSHGGLARGSWAVRSPLKAVSALDGSISSTFSLFCSCLRSHCHPSRVGMVPVHGHGRRDRRSACHHLVSLRFLLFSPGANAHFLRQAYLIPDPPLSLSLSDTFAPFSGRVRKALGGVRQQPSLSTATAAAAPHVPSRAPASFTLLRT